MLSLRLAAAIQVLRQFLPARGPSAATRCHGAASASGPLQGQPAPVAAHLSRGRPAGRSGPTTGAGPSAPRLHSAEMAGLGVQSPGPRAGPDAAAWTGRLA
jgi:hypothetical protein